MFMRLPAPICNSEGIGLEWPAVLSPSAGVWIRIECFSHLRLPNLTRLRLRLRSL